MQPAAVTSSACLVVHAQPTTLASVFHPFMETTAPTPLVRTDQHKLRVSTYLTILTHNYA